MKYLPFFLLPLIVWGCSTSKFISYKDKSYYAGHGPKKSLYMFPVSSITYGEPEIIYADTLLRISAAARNDSLVMFFDNEYSSLIKKYNKYRIVLASPKDQEKFKIRDSSTFFRAKVFDRKHKDSVEVMIPGKRLLDSLGINSNYVFHFSDLTVFNTVRSHNVTIPFVVPMKSVTVLGAAGANWDAPAFGLRGKYALWDNDSGRIICAGEFERELKTGKLCHKKIEEDFLEIIAGILNRTPYWAIIEGQDYNGPRYYK